MNEPNSFMEVLLPKVNFCDRRKFICFSPLSIPSCAYSSPCVGMTGSSFAVPTDFFIVWGFSSFQGTCEGQSDTGNENRSTPVMAYRRLVPLLLLLTPPAWGRHHQGSMSAESRLPGWLGERCVKTLCFFFSAVLALLTTALWGGVHAGIDLGWIICVEIMSAIPNPQNCPTTSSVCAAAQRSPL